MGVITKPIKNSNGNAWSEWAKNIAEVIGNKSLRVVIEKTYPDGTNTYGKIPFINSDITEQVDESGQTVSIFSFDGNNNLIYSGTPIPKTQIKLFDFNDKFDVRRNSGSGGTGGDSGDKFSVEALNVNISTNAIIEDVEIMEPISDAYEISVGEIITKRRSYRTDIKKDAPTQLDNTLGLAWRIKDLNSTELQLKAIRVIITLNWYDPNATGGN